MANNGRSAKPVRHSKRALIGAGVLVLLAGAILVAGEMRDSYLQARLFAGLASRATYWTEPGPSPSIRYTRTGPYDHRLGYAELPDFLERLRRRDYVVAQQARISPAFAATLDWGLFAPYREKVQAGLTVLDCGGEPLFSARYPERIYPTFETIPRILVDSLLFIENRELFRGAHPTRNPAIEWDRFGKALVDQGVHLLYPGHERPGGSTLATQIEKYRHSPEGRTVSGTEKLRQMASASLRSYLDGTDTFAARRRIVLDYFNTVPLAARPDYGEVHGLADGLRIWFRRDYRELNDLLDDYGSADPAARALAYKQALALMIAQRRPSYYLLEHREDLEAQTESYLRLLAEAGVIEADLRDAALAQRLEVDAHSPARPAVSFASRKAANAVRTQLATMLRRPLLYDLDRLDLTAATTLDRQLQGSITATLAELKDPDRARAAGLMAPRMLARGDPTAVIYSFTLYERTPAANIVLVQADNLDQPLDINENTKLDLGSTAKLRTLVTYLEIVAELHERYGGLTATELGLLPVAPDDTITRWALAYLAEAKDRTLEPMLEAALERRYSASPHESFFTGGGLHTFENFEAEDNHRVLTVREGLRRSVNLVFVRLMRDIARHTVSGMLAAATREAAPAATAGSPRPAADPTELTRRTFLARFADREGGEFIRQFHARYRDRPAEEVLDLLAQQVRRSPKRLAVIFRSVVPDADQAALAAFLGRHLAQRPTPKAVAKLYADYAPGRFDLADRGYLAGVHPLALAVAGHLRAQPGASLAHTLEALVDERQAAYAWLFKPQQKKAQDTRMRIMLEADAFAEIHRRWKRLGYPFDSLVPSYATALGASADRPAALAELMGILVNEGVRLPTVRIQSLHFAADTPFETRLEHRPPPAARVLPREVAAVTLRVLGEVVSNGTARRLKDVFRDAEGKPLAAGGKTGTGDHRYETYGRGGHVLSSQVVGRSGTFVFYLGERYFGTLTAHVRGPAAGAYRFTSSLPVQILRSLAPSLNDFLMARDARAGDRCLPKEPLQSASVK